ncbi:MAG: aldo/keto reductase [Armatimonadota bacterium]
MQYRKLGQSGMDASVIGLGTWAVGGWAWGGTDEQLAIEAIRSSIDTGINLIDTAPCYGLGCSEEIVGKAIKGCRDKVIIATKCGLVWHTDKGIPFFDEDGKPVHRYLGRESIMYEVEQSLERLCTDYIDLYQTHWQDSTTPIEETMSALMDLKDQGKIRAIGVSNALPAEMDQYRAVGPLDSDQELFSMLDRKMEAEVLPYCIKHNIAMLAYSPLGLGILTGKVGIDREFNKDDWRGNHPRYTHENRRKIAEMLAEIAPIASERNLSIAQLVIAWTIMQPGVTHTLCGARTSEHALENAVAGDVVLTDAELASITDTVNRHALGIA